MSIEAIAAAVRDVKDFPKPGIVFKDISPVLGDPALFREVIDLTAERYAESRLDAIVAIDARGFLFGGALAYQMGLGLQMVRKKGKLPWRTEGVAYDLEYGSNEVEIHQDAAPNGARVLLLDDVLATGGTAQAAAELVEKVGGKVVAMEFVIELRFLNGRDKLAGYPIHALIEID